MSAHLSACISSVVHIVCPVEVMAYSNGSVIINYLQFYSTLNTNFFSFNWCEAKQLLGVRVCRRPPTLPGSSVC